VYCSCKERFPPLAKSDFFPLLYYNLNMSEGNIEKTGNGQEGEENWLDIIKKHPSYTEVLEAIFNARSLNMNYAKRVTGVDQGVLLEIVRELAHLETTSENFDQVFDRRHALEKKAADILERY